MHGNPNLGREVVGNRKGRPKGALNYVTREARAFALEILRSPEYRASLKKRSAEGTLGAMEPVLWAYGFGKPVERVQIETHVDAELEEMSADELLHRVDEIREMLLAVATDAALPASFELVDADDHEDSTLEHK
jgi:hypothetical protein